jgi:hypothetical protein
MIDDCSLPIADCRLPIADCRLPIADSQFSIIGLSILIRQSSMGNAIERRNSQSSIINAIVNRQSSVVSLLPCGSIREAA